MLLLNTYDLGNYIQHFHHLQEMGLVEKDRYMFLIRQFFKDESCRHLIVTMISANSTANAGPCRIIIKNDDDWTTRVIRTYEGVTEAEKKLHGFWARTWDHTHRSMVDLTRVWGLLSFGQFEPLKIVEPDLNVMEG